MSYLTYKVDPDDEQDSLEDFLTRSSYYFNKYRDSFYITNKRIKFAYYIHNMKRNKNYLKGQKKEKSFYKIDISLPNYRRF